VSRREEKVDWQLSGIQSRGLAPLHDFRFMHLGSNQTFTPFDRYVYIVKIQVFVVRKAIFTRTADVLNVEQSRTVMQQEGGDASFDRIDSWQKSEIRGAHRRKVYENEQIHSPRNCRRDISMNCIAHPLRALCRFFV